MNYAYPVCANLPATATTVHRSVLSFSNPVCHLAYKLEPFQSREEKKLNENWSNKYLLLSVINEWLSRFITKV